MSPDPLPTVADLIARLGEPQNFAEQSLIFDLRELGVQHAQIIANLTDPTESLSAGQRGRLDNEADRIWNKVFTLVTTIECFRQFGQKPLMDGYEAVVRKLRAGVVPRLKS